MTGSLPRAAPWATGMTKADDAPACGTMRTSFFGYEKSKSALPACASLLEGVAKPPASAEGAVASSRSVGVTVCSGAASVTDKGMSGGNGGVSCRPWIGRVREGKARATAPGCGSMRTGFFGYEKSKSALTAPAPLIMWGSRRGARNRAAARAGGNGGAAVACGSAAGDDRYVAGMGVPATRDGLLFRSQCVVL